jgi:hypothetical protein
MVETPPAEKPKTHTEWLQPPTRILVRQRLRLGRWYYVLRPLAILYASLFRALREVLAALIYFGWWVFWLASKLAGLLLGLPIWLLLLYTRLRYGRDAADEVRRSAAEIGAEGRAWRRRANARLARRVGWPSESDNDSGASARASGERSP